MKLIKATKEDKTWYFSTLRKCALYIGAADSNVKKVLNGINRTACGWSIEEIESGEVLSKYIDPKRQ